MRQRLFPYVHLTEISVFIGRAQAIVRRTFIVEARFRSQSVWWEVWWGQSGTWKDSLQFLLIFLASIFVLVLDSHLHHCYKKDERAKPANLQPRQCSWICTCLHVVSAFKVFNSLFFVKVSNQCPDFFTSHSDCHDSVNASNCTHVNRPFLLFIFIFPCKSVYI